MPTRGQSCFGKKQVQGAEPNLNQRIEAPLSWMVVESAWQGSVKVSDRTLLTVVVTILSQAPAWIVMLLMPVFEVICPQ